MRARHSLIHGMLAAGLFVSVTASAQFRADNNFKGSGLDGNYGTYAPRGDCKREPQITVGDSGFSFRYGGRTTRPSAVATDGGYFGQQDTLLAFFPFPTGVKRGESGLEAADPGPVLIAFDIQASTLTLGASNPGVSLTSLQKALVRGSPYSRCGSGAAVAPTAPHTGTATPAGLRKLNFDKDKIKPTADQTAAIRRAAAADIKDFNHPDQPSWNVVLADLNDDGRPDLLVQYDDMGFCGSHGCSGVIVMATAHGYASHAIGLPNFYGEIDILAATHNGMHDLRFGDSPVWQWNGKDYDIPKAGSHATSRQAGSAPGHPSATHATSGGHGWETRVAANRTLAMVAATDSVVKTLSVFCDKGKPVLAMLVKARPPAGAVMLTVTFSGYPVVVPMGQGNREGTLWLSDLSRSDLPVWFSHRGSDATKQAFAQIATEASLAINGGRQGSISLANSTAATQAALSGCYHY